MERKQFKLKFHLKGLALGLVLAFLLLFSAATGSQRFSLSLPEQLLRNLAQPVQSSVAALSAWVRRLPAYFRGIEALSSEKQALELQIGQLQQRLSATSGQAHENAQLRQLLGLAEEMAAWQPLAARVIGRSSQGWQQSLIIDRGSAQGLASGMAVLDSNGLVGRLAAVGPKSAEVVLLTNPDSAVAAIIGESRWAGVVEPDYHNTGGLVLSYLPLLAELESGQTVLSSGLGGLYPAGLAIGVIGEVQTATDGLSQRATVLPYADFQRLEYVLVLSEQEPTSEAMAGFYVPLAEDGLMPPEENL